MQAFQLQAIVSGTTLQSWAGANRQVHLLWQSHALMDYMGVGAHVLAPAWGLAPAAIPRAVKIGSRAATLPSNAVLRLQHPQRG